MTDGPLDVVRAALRAYVDKDRAAMEALVAETYRFTSPLDNELDRPTYFERCWPNNETLAGFDRIHEVEQGDTAFVVYEGYTFDGKRFRNTEVHTVKDGQLLATEVYFGWDIPHKAAPGGFVDNDAAGHP